MSLKSNGRLSRREMLRALSLAAAGSTTLGPLLSSCRGQLDTPEALEKRGGRRDALDGKPKFLIVIGAAGGASIVDSFLAVRAGESANAATLNTFPDAQVQAVPGTDFRAVKVTGQLGSIPYQVNTDQLGFVSKFKDQMLVATSVGTSVNHSIAQKRSVTGNNAWKGRTLQEAVALQWGAGLPIPNVSMGFGGFSERGTDDSLPLYCYGETVANSSLFPLGLDGKRGILSAPDANVVALARAARNRIDQESVFGQTFSEAEALKKWNTQRGDVQLQLEAADLITKLNVLPDSPPTIPLAQYGLASSPVGDKVRAAFPNFFSDPLEGQAALAFLLLKYGVSVSVTIGPGFNLALTPTYQLTSPPLAFDFSHNDHRTAQAFMWGRILNAIDKLQGLLSGEVLDAASGETMWDRTMIYVATDFGRTRVRTADATAFGTGHDLNNGFLLVSPMVKGNTILGGVDPSTALTYGFDARTGVAMPGKLTSNEPDIYSGVLTAMGVDLSGSGLPDANAFKKA